MTDTMFINPVLLAGGQTEDPAKDGLTNTERSRAALSQTGTPYGAPNEDGDWQPADPDDEDAQPLTANTDTPITVLDPIVLMAWASGNACGYQRATDGTLHPVMPGHLPTTDWQPLGWVPKARPHHIAGRRGPIRLIDPADLVNGGHVDVELPEGFLDAFRDACGTEE